MCTTIQNSIVVYCWGGGGRFIIIEIDYIENFTYCSTVLVLYLDLMNFFQTCTTPNPVSELLTVMYDVRDWLLPINPQLHNISHPHVFVLKKNDSASVVLKYKNWSRDENWQPSNDPNKGLEILQKVCMIYTCI